MRHSKISALQENSDLMEQIELWSSFILSNLLWAIISIPLITLPAATAGLFAVMSQRVQGKQGELFQIYISAVRDYWRKATAIAAQDLLLGGIVALNLHIFALVNAPDMVMFLSRSVTFFVGLIALLVNLYAWPLLVVSDLSLRELISLSLKLVFAYPVRSFVVLGAVVIVVMFSLLLPQGIFVIASISLIVWIVAKGTWPVIYALSAETP